MTPDAQMQRECRNAAFEETLYTVIYGAVPIWFFALIMPLFIVNQDVWKILADPIKHGELFIISASFLGPISYIMTKSYQINKSELWYEKTHKRLPYLQFLNLFCILTVIFTSVCFIFIRFPFLENKLPWELNYDRIILISIVLFIFTCLVMYFSLYCRNIMERSVPTSIDISQIQQIEKDQMQQSFRTVREDGQND